MPTPSTPWRDALVDFGRRLRDLRVDAGLTQEALGEQIGYSGSKVSELERGDVQRVPSSELVESYISKSVMAWNADTVMKNARQATLLHEYRMLVELRDRLRQGLPSTSNSSTPAGDLPATLTTADRPADNDLIQPLSALARAVQQQWEDDQERRSIQDPSPLAVQWAAQDGQSGRFDELGALFTQLESRRLVVLGRSGSGKTASASQFILDLLSRRVPHDPVPVLFSLGAWDPARQRLPEWMADQLLRDHPQLSRKVVSSTRSRRTVAATLVDTGRVLPVLDGLDQLPHAVRGTAINAINRLGSDRPLVLTSQIDEYRDATAQAEHELSRTVVVELQPLALAEVCRYLLEGTGRRWQQVTKYLATHPEGEFAGVLSTPLMAWLARMAYRRPDTIPDELCRRFPDAASIESHLLDHLIPSVYPSHPTPSGLGAPSGQWTATDAQQGLQFLARHLTKTNQVDLAWWRLDKAVPHLDTLCRAVGGAAWGAGIGIVTGNPIMVIALAVLCGGAMASKRYLAFVGVNDVHTPHTFKFNARVLRKELVSMAVTVVGAVATLASILFVVAILQVGRLASVRAIALFVAMVLIAVVLTGWWLIRWGKRIRSTTPGTVTFADLERTVTARSTLRSDRAVALFVPGVALMLLMPAAMFVPWIRVSAPADIGLCIAWVIPSAYLRFSVARAVLALRGMLPWRTMRFLDGASERGILRQVGTVYEFRHPLLKDRLTTTIQHQ